jgi:hypothetical protein
VLNIDYHVNRINPAKNGAEESGIKFLLNNFNKNLKLFFLKTKSENKI